MKTPTYSIRILPLREQMRDTYRLLFFPLLLGVFALVIWWLSPWLASGMARAVLIGGCAGMLPSLVMGTPARMAIVDGDRATIEAWLAKHHIRDARGWVPKLPRAMYFDSQIVRFEGGRVIGPVIVLRKLRRLLRANPRMGA